MWTLGISKIIAIIYTDTLGHTNLAPLHSGGQLTSSIIACYQLLLKQKYNVGGLEDPVYGVQYEFSTQRGPFVQVLHVNQNHWIVISNMNSKPGIKTITKRRVLRFHTQNFFWRGGTMCGKKYYRGLWDCNFQAYFDWILVLTDLWLTYPLSKYKSIHETVTGRKRMLFQKSIIEKNTLEVGCYFCIFSNFQTWAKKLF